MNCPYCGKPMEKGRILRRRDFMHVWFPEGVKLPLLLAESIVERKKGMILNELKGSPPGLEAYLCKDCKKGVFDLL